MWVGYVCIWYMETPLLVFALRISNVTMLSTDRAPYLKGLLFELLL